MQSMSASAKTRTTSEGVAPARGFTPKPFNSGIFDGEGRLALLLT
jgi:hypothetical protein